MQLVIRKKIYDQLGASAVEYALAVAVITTMVMAGAQLMNKSIETTFKNVGECAKSFFLDCGGESSNNSSNSTPENEVARSGIIKEGLKWVYEGGKWLLKKIKPSSTTTKIDSKILKQMKQRGWDEKSIKGTVNKPHATSRASNKANGNEATAYFRKDGSYVVKDNKTGEIIQISNRNKPGWKLDPTIQNPYIP